MDLLKGRCPHRIALDPMVTYRLQKKMSLGIINLLAIVIMLLLGDVLVLVIQRLLAGASSVTVHLYAGRVSSGTGIEPCFRTDS